MKLKDREDESGDARAARLETMMGQYGPEFCYLMNHTLETMHGLESEKLPETSAVKPKIIFIAINIHFR